LLKKMIVVVTAAMGLMACGEEEPKASLAAQESLNVAKRASTFVVCASPFDDCGPTAHAVGWVCDSACGYCDPSGRYPNGTKCESNGSGGYTVCGTTAPMQCDPGYYGVQYTCAPGCHYNEYNDCTSYSPYNATECAPSP
jgi:hypothetical protein